LCENHVRMPIGRDALDHENMSIVVPGSDPRALKAGNLGRHVGCRGLHVELVRQRDDRLRIDGKWLGLSVGQPTHENHHNYHQQFAHVPSEAQPRCRSMWRQARSNPHFTTTRGRRHFRSWHKCEVPIAPSNVRVWRRTGKHLLARSISHFDPDGTCGQTAGPPVRPSPCALIDDGPNF
jgi:hypothetical protein